MTYFAKIHHYENEKLIAICDGNLMGKQISHNGVKLKVLPRFYGELEYDEDEILSEIRTATSINVMGKKICDLLVENDLVLPETIMWIPHEDQHIGHAIVVR